MPLYVRAIPVRDDGVRLCNLLTNGAPAHSIIDFLRQIPKVNFSQYPSLSIADFWKVREATVALVGLHRSTKILERQLQSCVQVDFWLPA
jgi:hypothetical protein